MERVLWVQGPCVVKLLDPDESSNMNGAAAEPGVRACNNSGLPKSPRKSLGPGAEPALPGPVFFPEVRALSVLAPGLATGIGDPGRRTARVVGLGTAPLEGSRVAGGGGGLRSPGGAGGGVLGSGYASRQCRLAAAALRPAGDALWRVRGDGGSRARARSPAAPSRRRTGRAPSRAGQQLAMDLRMLSRELSLYLEHQVRVGFFGSGVGLSVILGFSVAYACYYLSSIAKKPQLVTGGESFGRFLLDHCPVVTETYYPTVWCWESRGQTLLRPFITSKPSVQYRNELIKTADGGQILLDWFDNDLSPYYTDAGTRPTILLLPGLTGTSKESYILHMIHLSKELGYRCVVFNNRGLAGEDLLTPRTYCCANTEDVETAVHHVHSLYPAAPFLAAGVSMGGMLLLNYLGRIGSQTPLMGAATFSVGWNVFACSESLEKPLNWLLFNYYLTSCLQSSVNKHRHMFVKHIDMDLVMKAKSIREFDERFTSVMFGYRTIDDYYTDASPNRRLKSVGIPVLCLNSVDDVFSPSHGIPIETAKQNPNVALVLTSYGGHIGFLEGLWPRHTYMDRVFKQFMQAMVEHGHELS
ncbi:phospholipase ABHD3 [Tenrec ecaudatus]|uniref:phospholipase ABHD3 n=1 Tax=Tenrec ecaudatus TaxID=94439 RepID=UPI003F59160F